MLFNSWSYLGFLAGVLVIFWSLSRPAHRELVLVAAGYVFYMAWHPPYGLLLAALTLFGYAAGIAVGRFPSRRALLVAAGCAGPLGALAFFKYAAFLARSFNSIGGPASGLPRVSVPQVVLPLAISFFTFEVICYVVDVGRGLRRPERNLRRFALFLAFFPKLISGPIVRPGEFFPQLETARRFDRALFARGAHRFIVGLFLKVGVADTLQPYVALVFSRPRAAGFADAWVGAYAFAVQIFGDFAGYTAMAIGSALMLGFHLPENFDAPYFAVTIADFWRRWHMTLSRWLRDYLYIPLGGSRGSAAKTFRNVAVTMTLGGLWHGAGWTFVAWGALHGAFLAGHRLWQRWAPRQLPGWLAGLLTFHSVCLAWVLFRAPSFADATALLGTMVHPHVAGARLSGEGARAAALVALFFSGHGLARHLERYTWSPATMRIGRAAFYGVVAVVLLAVAKPPQPFIYFQF